jgi:hypothetical protein
MAAAAREQVKFGICAIALAGAALAGCGTTFDRERQITLHEVEHHESGEAVARINQMYDCHEAKEPDHPGGSPSDGASTPEKQLLLWRMERGMVAHLDGNLEASNHHLDDAARLVDERRTKSIAGEAGTLLINDTLRAYAGHGYEHIQVDYYRILNQLLAAEQADGAIGGGIAVNHAEADEHFGKAITRARRMTLEELPETADADDAKRYRDDPFARFLAGATTWALPPSTRREEDQEFAQVMFKRSLAAYATEHAQLSHDKYFHYAVHVRPRLVERLFLRQALAYDPGGYEDACKHFDLDPRDRPTLAAGDGMLLLIDHVGFISRPRTLSIGFGTIAPAITSGEAAQGCTATPFTVGGLVFWAKGPGSEVVGAWVVPLPTDVISKLTPGGMGIFGMEMPVHARQMPVPPLGRVVAHAIALDDPGRAADVPSESRLEVVSDLDAYARATLKDDQPKLLAKTIIRVVAKQVVAGEASVQAKHAVGGPAGQLVGAVVDLVGSGAATLSEVADIRAWTTLPNHVDATLVDLPAGSYNIELAREGSSRPLGTVRIHAGQLLVLPTRSYPQPIEEPR